MVTNEGHRWKHTLNPDLPQRMGIIDGVDKFDSSFFDVNSNAANQMDPQVRMLLELSYGAIMDAGIHPTSLNGSNTAVFVATTNIDTIFDSIYKQSSYDTQNFMK